MHIMRNNRLANIIFLVCLSFLTLGISIPAHAIPSLQLDIAGGHYDTSTQTIVAGSNVFTLSAYLIPDHANNASDCNSCKALLTDTYYISAAISPKYGPTGGNLGSFVFDGTTVAATSGMIYGNPPVDTALAGQGHDPGDLSPHDIFDTFFRQFSFKFDPSIKVPAYDTQTGGTGNGFMYKKDFVVDITNLDNPYVVHFDLYNTTQVQNPIYGTPTCSAYYTSGRKKGQCRTWNPAPIIGYTTTDIDICSFAPFSHDAESSQSKKVPEPATLLLLGSGLISLARFSRRLKK